MGERKGQNLYYPPDYDPKVGGLNKFVGTHALRERARKLHMGILIIRFEMPYNIWCEGCKNHIGMGVRYNAEKKKIGMYYSTPVYQFRMKCHLCDNHFEIKTDPGNLDYVIVSGARRQENRWDPTENGQIVPETKETQKRLFDDPMFKLEHKTGDEDVSKLEKPRLGRLVGRNENVWKDDYEANCTLRRNFRKRRKELEESSVNDSLILAKSSLDINLLPETEEDRTMAALLSLRPSKSIEESQNVTRTKLLNSPALPSSSGLLTSFGGLKKEESLSKSVALTRNSLGITIKRTKNEKVQNSAESADVDKTNNYLKSQNVEAKVSGNSKNVETKVIRTSQNIETNIVETSLNVETKIIGISPNVETKAIGTSPNVETKAIETSPNVETKAIGTSTTKAIGTNSNEEKKVIGTSPNVETKAIGTSSNEDEKVIGTNSNLETKDIGVCPNDKTNVIETSPKNEQTKVIRTSQRVETKTIGSLSLIGDYSSSEESG